jgi:hypothetical protein
MRVAPGSVDRWTALGTTSHYAIVDGSTSGAVEIDVTGPPEAELQVTAIPLGENRPRVDLSVTKTRGDNGEILLRAHLKEKHGQCVKLVRISWEPLSPGPNLRSRAACHGRLEGVELEERLGTSILTASGELVSKPIRLAGASGLREPLIVKVEGVGAMGERIWAWADVE